MIPAHVKQLLVDVYGTRWGEAYIEWWRFDDIPGTRGFGRAATASPPEDMAVFWSAGLLRPGTDRADENVEKLMVFVMDDVGKAPNSRFDPDDLLMLMPPPTSQPISSPGNMQWQWGITDGMDEDTMVALRRSLPWQSHATAMSNAIRLPMGIGGKPGVTHRVTDRKRGPVYTAAEFIQRCGGLRVPVVPVVKVRADLRAPSLDHVKAAVALLPNDGKAPYCDSEPAWFNFCQALHGATGGEWLEGWEAWCAFQPQIKHDPVAVWDRQAPLTSGWGTLLMYVDKWGVGDRNPLAALLFDDNPPPPDDDGGEGPRMFTVDDFRSVVGEAEFIHVGTGKFWKPASVDAKVAPMPRGHGTVKATVWMRAHRYVTELSWLPGRERIVEDCSMGSSGMERRLMHSIFNLYQAPVRRKVAGPVDAGSWIALVQRLWPTEAEAIFDWFAHRVQRPGEKCNHALVLGGAPGIGKDTVLEGVRRAVGEANCCNILPNDLRASFNDYVKSVLLVVNELRDDGQMSQYAFYDKSKTLIAAPPSTMTINSKYLKTYTVPNVCGVVMTTNYKQTGMYLPADDRRHLVCWSDADAIAEGDTEFPAIWAWMNAGGFDHIAEWLWTRDISGFDPKAPPRKTQAFMDIVAAAGSVEERGLQDKIEALGKPKILRIADLKAGAQDAFDEDAAGLDAWLTEHKFRRAVAEALDRGGYRQVRNPWQKDGRWKIKGRNEFVYGRKDVGIDELRALAKKLNDINEEGAGTA